MLILGKPFTVLVELLQLNINYLDDIRRIIKLTSDFSNEGIQLYSHKIINFLCLPG